MTPCNLLLSELRGYRGFQGLSVLINEAAHRAISLSYWQDEESAAEAGTRSLPLLMEISEPLIDRPPEISGYELLRHEVFPA
jgi:heme-degrading monooxygenase HmoA